MLICFCRTSQSPNSLEEIKPTVHEFLRLFDLVFQIDCIKFYILPSMYVFFTNRICSLFGIIFSVCLIVIEIMLLSNINTIKNSFVLKTLSNLFFIGQTYSIAKLFVEETTTVYEI
jgi:hypothetical protein